MSFSHYQHTSPAWDTNQYQFGVPPTPSFQSQPTWGGMDFYRAHAHTPDPSLYDNAWNRVRDHTGLGPVGVGVGTHEAKHWHHRAYGGVGELSRMHPSEIGHAAAYEAHRSWTHNSSMHEPLSGDTHRQREALIGLAVAEASRLLPFSGRQFDNYARTEASEAAAATASIIFYQGLEEMEHRSRSRSRHGASGPYGDPYAYNEAIVAPQYHRSHSRHRSHSHHSRPPAIQIRDGTMHSMSNGYAESGYATSMPTGVASSYGGHSSSYPSFPGNGNSIPINMPTHATPYPQTAMPLGTAASYHDQPMHVRMPLSTSHRGRSTSTSYAQNPYMVAPPMSSNGTMLVQPQPGQTIILTQKPPRKHKHHHSHHRRHHSSSRRSRSVSPYEDHYPRYR